MARPVVAALALLVLLAACSGAGSSGVSGPALGMGPGLSVTEARRSTLSEPLLVRGNLIVVDGVARLCEALLESHPPQCGGASLVVRGLDLTTIQPQSTANGVTWSATEVKLLGKVANNVLTVDRASAAGAR